MLIMVRDCHFFNSKIRHGPSQPLVAGINIIALWRAAKQGGLDDVNHIK